MTEITNPPATFSTPDPMSVASTGLAKPALLLLAAVAVTLMTGVIALTAAATLVAGGGSSSGKASSHVTRAAYDAKATTICAKYNEQADKVSQSLDQATSLTGGVVLDPNTARQVGHLTLDLAKIGGQEVAELRRLDRPIADSPEILQALAGEEQMVTAAKNLGNAYLRQGTNDPAAIDAAEAQVESSATSTSTAFQAVGASECAAH